jgi:hypothetical protein
MGGHVPLTDRLAVLILHDDSPAYPYAMAMEAAVLAPKGGSLTGLPTVVPKLPLLHRKQRVY